MSHIMPRRKKTLDAIAEELQEAAANEVKLEEHQYTENTDETAPKKRGRRKKAEFVTIQDVVSHQDKDTPQTIIPITDADTPLKNISIFDGIEDADDATTFRIPDVGFTLKGNGMFTDKSIDKNLMDWVPRPQDIYFTEKDGMIYADYLEKLYHVPEDREVLYYIISKKHYKERIPDLLQHINYFISHYDREHEYLTSTLSVKNFIDRHQSVSQKAFRKMVIHRIITPTMVSKVKHMAMDLYRLNINTDEDGKYKSTPKITNDNARMIVAVSFCIRLILPLCIHFSNTNSTFINKRDYIDCFDRIFMDVVEEFERGDTEIWNPICRFVAYRVERSYTSDLIIWEKKKQLYGITLELYLESLIHEVILVKSLHKLSFNRSVVSFIDGIITHSYKHYRYENFKFKPVEIEIEDSDSDEHMSRAETIEMQMCRVNEANQLITETNMEQVMRQIRERFSIEIPQEEFDFYFKNLNINRLTQSMCHTFFSKYFDDTNAIQLLDRHDLVELIIYLKKFMQLRGMNVLAQILTATVQGKFKDSCIKNNKFLETFTTSSVYIHIISTKFRYVKELGMKEDPIIKDLSTMINSRFVFVDFDPDINGFVAENIDRDYITSDYMLFLSIC